MMPAFRLRVVLATSLLLLLPVLATAAEQFTFIHMADTHINPGAESGKNLKAMVAEVSAMTPSPAFVLVSGDLTEMGFAEEYAKYRSIMSGLKMPVYNAMGNHEMKWSDWGKAGVRQFMQQAPYYSFDKGGIHFVALDTTMWLEHNGFIDQSQMNWLRKDLDKAGRNCPMVLFCHHGPGFLPNELEILKFLRPYNVRYILVGHGHTFNTYKRNGILFQMTQSALPDKGAYRILEVSDGEIRSFRKCVGQDRTEDGVISLSHETNPVTLTQPSDGAKMGNSVHIRARVMSSQVKITKVEYGIGEDYHECTPAPDGMIDVTIPWTGTPGWQTVSIRATDSTGMPWYDSAKVRLGGESHEVWRMRATGAIQRAATVAGDRIYFGAWGGDVYCLDARTGRTIWRASLGSDVISEVAVAGPRVYLGCGDGRIVALKEGNGRKLWEYKTAGPIQASPVVADGKVFLGSGDHNMYALDAVTGRLCWKYDTTHLIQAKPIYLNGGLFFGSWDRNFYALNASDGTLRWKTHIGELIYFSPANSNPATDGSRIIVTAQAWHAGEPDMFCLDVKTGEILWKLRDPGGKGQVCFCNPMIRDGRFVVSALSGGVLCLNVADGSKVWQAETGQEGYENSPIFSGSHVLFSGLQGTVFCFDAAMGKSLWKYSTGDGYLFPTPSVWRNLVIAPSTDGTVTALRDMEKK